MGYDMSMNVIYVDIMNSTKNASLRNRLVSMMISSMAPLMP